VLDFTREKEVFSYFRGKGPALPELKTAFAPLTSAAAASSMTMGQEEMRGSEELKASEEPKGRAEYLTERADLEDTHIPLHEEELHVGKREVDGGGVRLRKIVRTEKVQQGVDLRHEEIVIERVPARDMKVSAKAFQNEEFYIPLRYEEAVVEKEAHVREDYH